MGVAPGMRLVLLVPPSIDFISLVFALFKAGAVTVLIDPGMGRKNLVECLAEVEPEGFVGIPLAQAVRTLLCVSVSARRGTTSPSAGAGFGAAQTLAELRSTAGSGLSNRSPPGADDPAAIIFTTGSTGPPKGVLYRHGNFDRQVDEIRDFYDIQPGEIDLPGFPLFALFNCAMGVTTVIPDMDPTRPASVDPRNILEPRSRLERDAVVRLAGDVERRGPLLRGRTAFALPTLRRVLSAGAPVPPHVLARMKNAASPPDGESITPYGATEALPVASISASEVLAETAHAVRVGAGTCVGRRFPGIEWKVIRISDGPIADARTSEELPPARSAN